jgi:hypothetical protein
MDKKRSWVEIPSLEGLKVDWEHQPESAMDRRASVRMSMKALAKLFATKEMHVQVFVPGQMHTARLRDLSEGGFPWNCWSGRLPALGFRWVFSLVSER